MFLIPENSYRLDEAYDEFVKESGCEYGSDDSFNRFAEYFASGRLEALKQGKKSFDRIPVDAWRKGSQHALGLQRGFFASAAFVENVETLLVVKRIDFDQLRPHFAPGPRADGNATRGFDDEYWPVLAVLAWIARRRREDVEALFSEMNAPGSYLHDCNTPSGLKKSASAAGGPPDLQWLKAYFACEESKDGQTIPSLAESKAAFIKAARAGIITVSARCGNDERAEVSTLALQDMELADLYGSELVLEPGHWRSILCERRKVLKAFPSASASFAASSAPKSAMQVTQGVPSGCVSTAEIVDRLINRDDLHGELIRRFEAQAPDRVTAPKEQWQERIGMAADGWAPAGKLEDELLHAAACRFLHTAVTGISPTLQLYHRDAVTGERLRASPSEFEGDFADVALSSGSPPLFGETPQDRIYFAERNDADEWIANLTRDAGGDSGGLRNGAQISAETQAREYFSSLGKYDPDREPRTKAEAIKAARAQFPELSAKAAMRAWSLGAHNSRKLAGAKKRPAQN